MTHLKFREVCTRIIRQEAFAAHTQLDNLVTVKKHLKTPQYPSLVQIGITNVCNKRCKQCVWPEFSKRPGYQPNFMKSDLYQKIIDEVATFPADTVLRFLGRGESLLHPELENMIKLAKDRLQGNVALITNGQLLSGKRIRGLLATGVDVIDVSVDALTQASYEKVRWGNLRQLEASIKRLVKLRNSSGSKTRLMVSFLLQPENYLEAEEFRDKWSKIVDKVIFRQFHSYAGQIAEKPTSLEEERYPCAALWSRVSIDDAGKITLCYVDWDETTVLADLNKEGSSILKTWRTEYEKYRQGHITSKYPRLCANCKTGWQAAHWNLTYEKAMAVQK